MNFGSGPPTARASGADGAAGTCTAGAAWSMKIAVGALLNAAQRYAA